MLNDKLSQDEVLQLLNDVGAVITGSHIVYQAGDHGSAYVNKDALYPHTDKTALLCRAIAKEFEHMNIEAVLAPAIGGVILSQWVTHFLNEFLQPGRPKVLALYAEKSPPGTGFVVKRGYDKLANGKRLLVVEDILKSGGSALGVVEAARLVGGEVIGVAALCNRGNVKSEDVGNPKELFALCNVTMDKYKAAECPLCAKQVPINTDVGHGREFLANTVGSA